MTSFSYMLIVVITALACSVARGSVSIADNALLEVPSDAVTLELGPCLQR